MKWCHTEIATAVVVERAGRGSLPRTRSMDQSNLFANCVSSCMCTSSVQSHKRIIDSSQEKHEPCTSEINAMRWPWLFSLASQDKEALVTASGLIESLTGISLDIALDRLKESRRRHCCDGKPRIVRTGSR